MLFQVLVVGAEQDRVVDPEGVEETAAFLGVAATVLDGMPHDVMLGEGWQRNADTVLAWLDERGLSADRAAAARSVTEGRAARAPFLS